MKNLFALLIGVGDYPVKGHELYGCRNDVKAIKDYLENRFAGDANINLEMADPLIDDKASRDGVIDGFRLFEEAKDGDICFLYYTGHGSRIPSPKFLTNRDNMNESILCYDSRLEDGWDLADKELSWLIWNSSKGKNLNYIVMMDCCHAGGNTRGPNTYIRSKMADPGNQKRDAEEYLGFTDYKKVPVDGKEQYTVPSAPHLHLAAARSDETAKEMDLDGDTRGVFTHMMLKTLQDEGDAISYANLMNKTAIRISQVVRDQSPILTAHLRDTLDIRSNFLSESRSGPIHYQVRYTVQDNWNVNAGALHGVSQNDSVQITSLDPPVELNVLEVRPNMSKLTSKIGLNFREVYDGMLIRSEQPVKIALLESVDDQLEKMIRVKLEQVADLKFELIDDPKQAQYFIAFAKDHILLTEKDEVTPVFQPVQNAQANPVLYFLNQVNKLANYLVVLELSNPNTTITEDDLEIRFFRTTAPGNYENDAPVEQVESIFAPIRLDYLNDGQQWHGPGFKCQIVNRSEVPLFVSVLYMGLGRDERDATTLYYMDNRFMQKVRLEPGNAQWLEEVVDEEQESGETVPTRYTTLPFELGDDYIAACRYSARIFLKVFVSTEDFDTDRYIQSGLPMAQKDFEVTRTAGRRKKKVERKPDWRTFDIPLIVTHSGYAKN